ncbi:MAG TPA: ATP-binding protein, partial [Propionibacteriaceae bacterium]|nr:ATP-binding protein [Propionibacteriaceae bacterium]
LDDARRVFGLSAVALLDGDEIVGEVGAPEPQDIEVSVDAGDNRRLVMWGTPRVGEDRRLMGMIAATASRLWQTEQLAAQARRAEELARIDEVRVALLAAVGHDLRSPLAAIKASVSTLLESDIEMEPAEAEQLLAGIDENTDRLTDLVSNLLDMSRIQAGAVSVQLRPTAIEEALEGALRAGGDSVDLDLPEGLPLVMADAGLLERVLGNLVDNARRFLPDTGRVAIRARTRDGWMRVEVIDHGPGVPPERFEAIFTPFQRFDDRGHAGTGLGLAIARGFTEAMGGRLTPSRTPRGGLTMTVELEVSNAADPHR